MTMDIELIRKALFWSLGSIDADLEHQYDCKGTRIPSLISELESARTMTMAAIIELGQGTFPDRAAPTMSEGSINDGPRDSADTD